MAKLFDNGALSLEKPFSWGSWEIVVNGVPGSSRVESKGLKVANERRSIGEAGTLEKPNQWGFVEDTEGLEGGQQGERK